MVQCATRHFEQKPAEGGQPCVSNSDFIYVPMGSNRWDFHTFVQISAIQIDMQSRILSGTATARGGDLAPKIP
jgi:hypothetical protein